LEAIGFKRAFDAPFFKEFTIKTPIPAGDLVHGLLSEGFLAGIPLGEDQLLVAVTEKRTRGEIDRFVLSVEGLICRRC